MVRQTAEVAKESGIPFFDLNSLLADQYDAMGQPAAKRCFADPAFVTNYGGARLAAEAIVKLLLVQSPVRIQNFLKPTIAIRREGQPLQPPTSDNSKSYWQVMADYRAIDRGMSQTEAYLTAEELEGLNREITELMQRHRDRLDRDRRPAGSRLCELVAWGVPIDQEEQS